MLGVTEEEEEAQLSDQDDTFQVSESGSVADSNDAQASGSKGEGGSSPAPSRANSPRDVRGQDPAQCPKTTPKALAPET